MPLQLHASTEGRDPASCRLQNEKMRLERVPPILVSVLLILAMPDGPVSAHHSTAGFEKEVIELHGIVAQYIWRNPHVVVVWDAKDSIGNVVQWSGQMNSPTSMISVGMNRNSLKPGDEIIVTAYPSRSRNPVAVIQKITFADGKVVIDRLQFQ